METGVMKNESNSNTDYIGAQDSGQVGIDKRTVKRNQRFLAMH